VAVEDVVTAGVNKISERAQPAIGGERSSESAEWAARGSRSRLGLVHACILRHRSSTINISFPRRHENDTNGRDGCLTNPTQVDNMGKSIQQAVGTRIVDGTPGKEDRVLDMLDLLGCTPLVPVASPVLDDGFGQLEKQARSSSFLGNLSISFPSVSKMLGCVGTGYAVAK